jgi:hypothetical protein
VISQRSKPRGRGRFILAAEHDEVLASRIAELMTGFGVP